MIIVIGLVILVAAVVVGLVGVVSNGGSDHALTHRVRGARRRPPPGAERPPVEPTAPAQARARSLARRRRTPAIAGRPARLWHSCPSSCIRGLNCERQPAMNITKKIARMAEAVTGQAGTKIKGTFMH